MFYQKKFYICCIFKTVLRYSSTISVVSYFPLSPLSLLSLLCTHKYFMENRWSGKVAIHLKRQKMKQNGSYYSLTYAHKIILLASKQALEDVGFTSKYWSELPTQSLNHNYCSRMTTVVNQANLAIRKQCAAKWCLYMIKENKYWLKGTLSLPQPVHQEMVTFHSEYWKVFQVGEYLECRSVDLLSKNDGGLQANF